VVLDKPRKEEKKKHIMKRKKKKRTEGSNKLVGKGGSLRREKEWERETTSRIVQGRMSRKDLQNCLKIS